ncbi:MAG TPA: ABC-2 family transporter protein [Phycisphaerae bacterium]|nr:ABC-2 family transporter protein [Phycisphaerae bacterium]
MWRYPRLLGVFTKVSIQDNATYRADFLVHAVMSFLHLGAEVIGLWTIFTNTRSLAGWTVFEVVTLVGVFRIMSGIVGLIVAPNMRQIMEDIRDGRLDFALIKPLNSQFYVSVRRIVLWRVTDVAIGMLMVAVGCAKLASNLTPVLLLQFVVMLAAGVTIIYSFWLVLATSAFWFTRISNIEMVFWNVFEAGRYPVTIYPRWIRLGLTYVLPLAFLTTFPAGMLVGKLGVPHLAGAIALAIVSSSVASIFWRIGLRHYSGASA